MQSAVEADLKQLALLFIIHRQLRPAIETSEMKEEIGRACAKSSTTLSKPATCASMP